MSEQPVGSDCNTDPRSTGVIKSQQYQMHGLGSQQVGWRGAITQKAAMKSGFGAALDDGEPPAKRRVITPVPWLWGKTVPPEEYTRLLITYQEKAATRPIARIHLSDRQDRISDEALRSAFTLHAWAKDGRWGFLFPCVWCGRPTAGFCDGGCRENPCQSPVCPKCTREFYHFCRICYEKMIWGGDSDAS